MDRRFPESQQATKGHSKLPTAMPDMATSRRANLILGSHRDDADYGRSAPPLKKQLSSGQKRFNQIPRSPLCPTGIASIEILPSAWVQTSFRHEISNQTPGVPEALAARRFSSGMARISAVLSSRSPGQKNVNRFSFGDICSSVWIGVTDSKRLKLLDGHPVIWPPAVFYFLYIWRLHGHYQFRDL